MHNTNTKQVSTSVLIIGSGGSGLRAGIELSEMGVDVLVVGKRHRMDPHTVLAAGGINAALATMDPDDTWEQHAADTLKEGYMLGDPLTVETVTKGAAKGIEELEAYGMNFAREEDGRISQRYFGAHKWRRTAFSGDYTGLEIQRALVNKSAQLQLPILDTVYITHLLVDNNKVFGAYGFDINNGTHYQIYADSVILAAGGHNRIWRNTSSRRDENNGDSWRLAVEAGCSIRDAELVQFHPSGILKPDHAAGHLITEAARGESGVLRNALGERFMEKYDPQRLELSTRDRISLACYTEIKEGRGTENGGVWLDLTHIPKETILERLPRVYHDMIEFQTLDVSKNMIEIAPTAHYSMGGVKVSADTHQTDVEGLFAIGEAASGLHGANRLGGNSLIELLVYGRIVGQAAAKYSAGLKAHTRNHEAVKKAKDDVTKTMQANGSETVRLLQRQIRDTMTEHVAVVRTEEGLKTALKELKAIEERVPNISVNPDAAGYSSVAHAYDLRSSVLAAKATIECALERRETRGCHNRSDYPKMDPSLQVNLVWSPSSGVVKEALPEIPKNIAELM